MKTIVHEVTHQWLGNLVTMEFWNDLWLNEGLTTYVSTLAFGDLLELEQVSKSIFIMWANVTLHNSTDDTSAQALSSPDNYGYNIRQEIYYKGT